jgi:hypothetical protein
VNLVDWNVCRLVYYGIVYGVCGTVELDVNSKVGKGAV